jgi:hypothetical protein
MHTNDIQRRDNGTIDIDFYRQRALSERQEVMNSFLRRLGAAARPLIAVAVLAFAAYSVAVRPPSTAGEVRSSPPVQFKGTLTLLRTIQPI